MLRVIERAVEVRGWHPVGVGLMIYMLTLVVFNVIDAGVLGGQWDGDIVSVIAGISAAAIVAGWWWGNRRMSMYGYLIASWVIMLRTTFLLLEDATVIGVWLGFGVACIAGGSYVKESHALARGEP